MMKSLWDFSISWSGAMSQASRSRQLNPGRFRTCHTLWLTLRHSRAPSTFQSGAEAAAAQTLARSSMAAGNRGALGLRRVHRRFSTAFFTRWF
jgi:hypothetical protein